MNQNMRVNPEMIMLARDVKGLSQGDLAVGASLNQSTISRYEAGVIDVPADHLERIAAFLERPVSFFYWSEQLYDSSCMYHRKNRRLSVAELRVIHAKVNLLRIQSFKLLQSANIKSRYSFYRLDQSKYGGPEGCARELRRLWQLPPGPVKNVTRAIESAGGIVFRCPFGLTRVDGISQWILEDAKAPPVFFVHDDISGDRQRLTLAHEIGHVVMHHMPPVDDIEVEANRFAAEFHMPADEIAPELSNMTLAKAAALKSFWKVSMQSIIYRAHELKKISDSTYSHLFRQLSVKGYRKSEPVPIPSEEPSIFRDLLKFHTKNKGRRNCDVSEMLGELEDNFITEHGGSFSGFRLVG